jgi:hypothetical protein
VILELVNNFELGIIIKRIQVQQRCRVGKEGTIWLKRPTIKTNIEYEAAARHEDNSMSHSSQSNAPETYPFNN